MKRLRSYVDDLDSVGEKGICKDWRRRDQDSERSSSHRRYYSKTENGRKGLSSSSEYDRSMDDDREVSRSLRKRLDHDSESSRRKSFDRYRDCSDRGISISSPRISYGVERIHRSESFSGSRREFPKRFRSERDRSRREGSVSSWRRFGGSKDVDEDPTIAVHSSRGARVASEDRGNVRSPRELRDTVKSPPCSKDSGGEQSKSVEVKKNEEVQGESSSSSEMEEGELEPEPESESESKAPVEKQEEFETENQIKSDRNFDDETKLSSEEKIELNKEDARDVRREVGELEAVTDEVNEMGELPDCQNKYIDGLGGKGEEAAEDNGGGEKLESYRENHDCSPSPNHEPESHGKEEATVDANAEKLLPLQDKQKEDNSIDLEVEVEDIDFSKKEEVCPDSKEEVGPDSKEEIAEENRMPEVTLNLIKDKPTRNGKDKGKSPLVSASNEANSTEDGRWIDRDHQSCRDDAIEGQSSRGFELFFSPAVVKPDKTNHSDLNNHKDEKLKLGSLELSLGLPNVSLPLASHNPIPAPSSPSRAKSFQSLPTTFRTSSDGFTASISFSGSQRFSHNPSCSLTQNSFDNYEQSVGSHPLFQGVDQVSQGTWQVQPLNEPKRKEVPLYQTILLNGNGSLHQSQASQGILNGQAMQGQQHLKVSEGSSGLPVGLDRKFNIQRQLSGVQLRHHDEVRSPTHSVGSHEIRSEYSKDKKRVMREKSGGSLFKSSSQREMEQLLIGETFFFEKIITMIVSEPIQVMAKRIHEMPEQSIACLKESAGEMIVNEDKRGQVRAFQEALQNRSDLTLETLSKSHRAQLEILVALKTGLQDFLRHTSNIPSSVLAEIFLNLRCRNLACSYKSLLPVDDCDCKVCGQKNGFCSACMCLVCLKFDTASNTCSWAGCDVCLHWCHTECGLRESHIRNGQSVAGAQGTTEMQFHCVACDHPSEMFGFVKEVFKTCAKEWKAETLSKELDCVKKIFRASNDVRGKRLHYVAEQMLVKLENKSNLPEVYNHFMELLTGKLPVFSQLRTSLFWNPNDGFAIYILFLLIVENDSKFRSSSISSVKELPHKNQGEGSNGVASLSQEAMRLTSASMEKAPSRMENAGSIFPSLDWDRVGRRSGDSELQMSAEKKPVVDELESIVRIKQEEAKMFQTRADDARREAEALKRIAIAKNEKIEQEYASRITKLRLVEAEERRRQKVEELQGLEKAHHEYLNMKTRMEADIKDLLLKMEATKRNLST
ncbi:hypothetical protein HHK36_019793 [Tetracentron sinense]|uniref:Protein OBERON 4 n=1 Tax=Tetracentron sinense TaxID=13715 RepID=A0A835DD34_TETSI|nr:hypothetical protein HHK36_019793 [Tetracentron sinense]